MRRLAYVGQMPAEGTGSPVIILRHLRRLAARGWEITVIGEPGQDPSAITDAGWTVGKLPLRRTWWPPFRETSPILRAVRTALLARECRRLAGAPDAIVGYLAAHADFSPEVAAHFAGQSRRPLSLLVHDDAAAFYKDDRERTVLRRRHRWIMRRSHRTWFVSPELAEQYDVAPSKRRVLLPIPEGWDDPADWRDAFADTPRVYYAGSIWPAQYPLLEKISRCLQTAGARLVLLSRETPALREFRDRGLADWVEPFARNRDALRHLRDSAAGLVISYTETAREMPWAETSFPSKFVEYAHLGVPCAIVASRESCIARWARRESYPHAFAPDRLDELAAWAGALRSADAWRGKAVACRALARGAFNPVAIHREFEDGLLRRPGADAVSSRS